ncbi:MAG: galactokinase [Bacilli bacterium]
MEPKKTVFIERLEELNTSFYNQFHEYPDDVFSSSGRIEIIGNHLDHNHGSVMVGTIDLSILAVVKPTQDNSIRYVTSTFPEIKIDLSSLEFNEMECGTSLAIIKGILFQMKQLGYNIGGCKIFSSTNIFKGAGVSSSAAFENLIGQIMNYYYNDSKIKPMERAKISQYAERVYFNKPCGLLDQAGIALGGINYIDFYSVDHPKTKKIEYEFKKYDFIIVNTRDSHSKLIANYSQIIDDMKLIANHYSKEYLIDVDEKKFFSEKDELAKAYGERSVGRAVHFFEENRRVKNAFAALMNNDEDTFARLIQESGDSSYSLLKNCYVENEEENLPKAIKLSKSIIKKGAVRVHGGGFAGTILAFIDKEESREYIRIMRKYYGYKNVRKLNISRYGSRYVGKVKKYIGVEQ